MSPARAGRVKRTVNGDPLAVLSPRETRVSRAAGAPLPSLLEPESSMIARTCRPLPLIAALASLALFASTVRATAAQPVSQDAPSAIAAPTSSPTKERVVFGVSDADPQKWSLTLGNIANAIEGVGAGGVEIELVAYGPGIAMLKKDSPVAERIEAAIRGGVRVVACQNSMRGFHIEPADLAPGVGMVPSGVVELMRRQHDGYAYIRS
jgi:intracellular sulfur oxidation DsrE/DsrF family protein